MVFVQKEGNKDETSHLYSLIYKFFSPITGFKYILRADYHTFDVFAIKFYVDQQKESDKKYSIITNKGDAMNIIVTCAKVVPLLLVDYPHASFAFAGSRSIDKVSNKIEDIFIHKGLKSIALFLPDFLDVKRLNISNRMKSAVTCF